MCYLLIFVEKSLGAYKYLIVIHNHAKLKSLSANKKIQCHQTCLNLLHAPDYAIGKKKCAAHLNLDSEAGFHCWNYIFDVEAKD